MSAERVPWQAEDPESGAVQVSGRPIHASWSILREHFRRVFLEPHRPAGSDVVGWRWVGASVPRAPEAADMADIRQLLQHALLDITADLERREEDPAATSPRELLAAVKAIVHDLSGGTDIDLATYAVETDTGWFIRSWGFSHPAPAKLADPSEAVAETPPETPAETPVAAEAPVVTPPVSKRPKLIRWAAGAVVVLGVAAAVFWFKGCARSSPAAEKPGQPKPGTGEHHAAPEAEAAHQAPPSAPTAPAAPTPAHGEAATPSGASGGPSTPPAAPALPAAPAGANEATTPGFSTIPAPRAQVGGIPVLPGQTGELGGANAPVITPTETPLAPSAPGGAEAPAAPTVQSAESAGPAGASTPKQAGGDAPAPLTNSPQASQEPPAAAPGSGPAGLAPEAPPAPGKETTAGRDAVSHSGIHASPATAQGATAAPEAAKPAPEAAAPVPPKPSESPAVTEIVWVNKNASPPPGANPAPVKFDLTPDAYSQNRVAPVADSNARLNASTEAGSTSPGSAGAPTEAADPAHAAAAAPAPAVGAPSDPSGSTPGGAPAKAPQRVESTTVVYQIGECKVLCLRDPVLPTAPAERPSSTTLVEARAQAWAGTQASRPESFRRPVINGGWSFRPAKGATWTKHPVWVDTTTGKPVDGLRVSANGLHLTWTGLVPAEGFTAHVVDENGVEQARISLSPTERLIEVTTIAVFSESAPTFTVDLTTREAVSGSMVWHSRTPAWSDRRWETQILPRQTKVKCLPMPAIGKEPTYGVVSLTHPASGWALTWEVRTRPSL